MTAQVLTNTKQDLILAFVQKELEAKLKVTAWLSDFSAMAGKGAQSINVPRLSSFTAANRSHGAAYSEATPLTDATDPILLDQTTGIMWAIDKADEVQSTIDFEMQSAARAVSAVGRFIDNAIYAGLDGAAGLSVNGASPADVTAANMRALREYVLCNEGELDDMVYLTSCDQETVLLGIADFVRADSYGNSPTAISSGVIGRLYGVPVIIDNRIKAQQIYCLDKAGYGYAFQRELAMDEQKDVKYGVNGVLKVVEAQWGHGPLEVAEKSAGAGNSPLIAALTN